MEDRIINGEPSPKYFDVGVFKYIVMSFCTLGIYELYWQYKNWQYIRDRDGLDIRPFWRAFFAIFWFYPLLTDISKNSQTSFLSDNGNRIFLTVCFVTLSVVSNLPDPYFLLSFFSIVPALPALKVISKQNVDDPDIVQKSRNFRSVNALAVVLGGPLMIYVCLSSLGFFPSTQVVAGDALKASDIDYLRENEILGVDEEILYFYSAGVFSIANDGQFISNDYVTSYWVDPGDGELYMAYTPYQGIRNIKVEWGRSTMEDTVVTIILDNGDTFDLWLSHEAYGDKKFIKELRRLWKERRPASKI